jgi:hypothetical protein
MSVHVVAGKPSVSSWPATPPEAITWSPVSPNPTRLNFIGTSLTEAAFALQMAFPDRGFPMRLNKDDIPTLRGMVAGAGDGHMPYTELLNALAHFGGLEVTLV